MSHYLQEKLSKCVTTGFQHENIRRWVGILSFFGFLAWFTAFALQNAAYVKSLGQVEILASFAISFFIFGEKLRRSEVLGILLLTASVVLLLVLL